jgi:hypothetical protein
MARPIKNPRRKKASVYYDHGIINFREIPPSNEGGVYQDRFEQFACDFFETRGYKIIQRPDRGPDGDKDMIISESRSGIGGTTIIRWLVSCKHKAHSNKAVSANEEQDIFGRVTQHKCQGFLGFYSTIASAALSNKILSCRPNIEADFLDNGKIERDVLKSRDSARLLATYFPSAQEKLRQLQFSNEKHEHLKDSKTLTEEDVLRITKTAIIIIEIETIKEEYFNNIGSDWTIRTTILYKLYRYTEHTNEKIAAAIFDFVQQTVNSRLEKPSTFVVATVKSLIFTYFPSTIKGDHSLRLKNGKSCLDIAYYIIYDGFTHHDNFAMAEHGLSIFKFVYHHARRLHIQELEDYVNVYYDELELALRTNDKDFVNARLMLQVFKNDLGSNNLVTPTLPAEIITLILKVKS